MPKQTYPKLPAEFKKKWVAALRSGEYKQGMGLLKGEDWNGGPFSYCCLGVACEVAGCKNIDGPFIRKGAGIRGITKLPKILIGDDGLPDKLAKMNDFGKSFKQIANWIEKNL